VIINKRSSGIAIVSDCVPDRLEIRLCLHHEQPVYRLNSHQGWFGRFYQPKDYPIAGNFLLQKEITR